MKKTNLLIGLAVIGALSAPVAAGDLVILHTNDTHSLIEPGTDGKGGVLQRKAIIDSVRKAEKNVILVDAGDIVQGSLYFKYFKGDVEYPLMNMMGYDIQILGNHEFDNGLEDLAKYYKTQKASRLSANYDFTGTPLKGVFDPYVIKKVDGKKIGFFGININPESLIAKDNYSGLVYHDAIEEANKTAALLKKKGCDLVVAVTHIGYKMEPDKASDIKLAESSKDIDIIIGGHSHTRVDPADESNYLVRNTEGRPVMVVQTGKSGRELGYIKIDLDDLVKDTPEDFEYKLIPVTDRFAADKLDSRMKAFLEPYKVKVDSVNARVIARSIRGMSNSDRVGGYPNWVADFADWYGELVSDSLRSAGVNIEPVDFAIMNVGGIRSAMPEGEVTEGQLLSTFPFANRMVITRIKGSDIMDALGTAARKGGEAVSKEIRVTMTPEGDMENVYLNLEPLNPERYYNIMTIDYLSQGNDDLTGLGRGEELWRDSPEMIVPLLRYVNMLTEYGLPIAGDTTPRFVTSVR